jgi:hypothetical protein
MVWEAENGGEFYILGQHKAAANDVAWRADSNLLASCSADGTIIVWEMNEGKKVKDWAAHGGGVQSVSFTPDGKIVSSGNDGLVRVWDINGTKLAEAPSQGDIVTKVVAGFDSKSAVSANWRGEIIQWNLGVTSLIEVARYVSNPSLIAQRIVQAEQRMAELTTKLPSLQAAITKADANVKTREAALAKVRADVAEDDRRSKAYPGEIANDEKALAAAKAALTKALADHKARVEAIKQHADKVTKLAALTKDQAAAAAEAAKLAPADKATADASAALEGAKKELAAKAGDAALTAKVKGLEGKLAAAKAEQQKLAPVKAKADQLTAAMNKAKAELGAAPALIADLDKLIAETTSKIKTLGETLTAKKALLPKLPALVKAGPDRIKAAEAALNQDRGVLSTAQFVAKSASDEIGVLSSAMHRDDFSSRGLAASGATQLPFEVNGAHLIVLDDVLYTGRTIRAVLNELFDYGRPASVKLAVLVDRGGRELPVQADLAMARMALPATQSLQLARSETGQFSFQVQEG